MSKNVTLRDIAKKTGIGLATVGRAMNGNGYVSSEKKEIILACAKELGYEAATPKQQTQVIGVILPDTSNFYYGSFLRHVELVLDKYGYRTMLFNTLGAKGRVSQAIELAENGFLNGLIVNADMTAKEKKRLEPLPVVSLERLLGDKIPMVSSAHKEGGQIAAKILLENRCNHVAIFTVHHKVPVYADIRIEECAKILRHHRVDVWVVELDSDMATYTYIEEQMEEFLRNHREIDGIFSDDISAYFAVKIAVEMGKIIPRDFKVVGYDGSEITKLIRPNLTTIEQDMYELAKTSVEVLNRRIMGEEVEEQYLIPVKEIRAGTTL
ncbi:MAG: substrate-binding domain-containing protein [Lachnospiraceae bacterium]|nr:substrate-binding domain-containing protein [Lachnospiraceae bacterium]